MEGSINSSKGTVDIKMLMYWKNILSKLTVLTLTSVMVSCPHNW